MEQEDDPTAQDAPLASALYIVFGLIVTAAMIFGGCKAAKAVAAPYMGDCKLAVPRTYTVSIDPALDYGLVSGAMNTWNAAFVAEYGFPVFATHYGDWWDADVLITAHGDPISWVNTRCKGNYVQRGNNLAVMNVGPDFNSHWFTHELGHVLGFADYIFPTTDPRGFDGYGICQPASAPISIMSYCWQQEPVVLLPDDYALIRSYWR